MVSARRADAETARATSAPRTGEPSEADIRRRAFEIYKARGGAPGHEAEDWAQAERELRGPRQRS